MALASQGNMNLWLSRNDWLKPLRDRVPNWFWHCCCLGGSGSGGSRPGSRGGSRSIVSGSVVCANCLNCLDDCFPSLVQVEFTGWSPGSFGCIGCPDYNAAFIVPYDGIPGQCRAQSNGPLLCGFGSLIRVQVLNPSPGIYEVEVVAGAFGGTEHAIYKSTSSSKPDCGHWNGFNVPLFRAPGGAFCSGPASTCHLTAL